MTKKILSIALAIAAFSASGMYAQQDRGVNSRGDSDRSEMSDKMYRPQKFTDFAFEGILLDINQQAKMDSLNAIYQPNGKIGEKCNLQDKKLDKQDKNLNKKDCCKDKDSLKQSGKQCAGKQDRMENRRKYVEGVKEILTPDQYTLFLENIVLMPMKDKPAKHHHVAHERSK